LRNPLGAIQGSIDLVRTMTDGGGRDVAVHLDRMERSVERCNRIISDLLEFTRIKALKKHPILVDAWLNELLEEHKLPAEVSVRRELNASGLSIQVDPMRLRQIMINLMDNAAQALTTKGWNPADARDRMLTVRTAIDGSWLKLSVMDNGPGIDSNDLDRIFEPLFTTKSFGVGLGLPTVRQLVEQHEGTVAVDSSAGRGTTFTIGLPLTDAATNAQSVRVGKVA
jgi:signal transduction histidine kinase